MTLTICFCKGLSVRLSLPVSPDGLLGSVSRKDFWAACTLSGQWTVGDSFSVAHSPLSTWRRSSIKLHSSQRPKSFICLFPVAQLKSDPTNKRKNPFSYATAEGPSPLRSDLPGGHCTALSCYHSLLAKSHPGIKEIHSLYALSAPLNLGVVSELFQA